MQVSNEADLSPKPADLEKTQTKAPQSEDNISTLASLEENNSNSSSSLEDEITKPSVSPSNPSPGVKPMRARPPRPVRQKPEERLADLVSKHPLSWSCKDVGDWLECLAFGKYRKTFTHHSVVGALLPKLKDSTLKEELGVTSLGHREMLLRSITGLFEMWAKQEEVEGALSPQATSAAASPLTTPKSAAPLQSPVITIPGAEIIKAQERCTHLAHDLEKATTRAAQRRATAEQAQRNAELADKEVERLTAALKEAEIEAQGGKFAMATKLGGNNLHSSPRKKEMPGVDDTKFMDRLHADLEAREKKAKLAAGVVKKGGKGAVAATGAEADSDSSVKACLEFLQSICAEKEPSFTEFLQLPDDSDAEESTKLASKIDDLVGRLAGEFNIDGRDVEIVKNAQGFHKKAQKLTIAVKKAIFMQRLDQDLSAREHRNKELKQQLKAERAAAIKAAEEKDLKEALVVFAELGWPVDSMQGGADDLLGALLKRARAAQVGKAAAKAVDWELYSQDGLLALISEVANKNNTATPPPAVAAPLPTVLQATVTLLSQCREDELDRLDALKGIKKLLATYRALRAQQFLQANREKLEAKAAKAAEYQAAQQPERKILPKEAGEAFLQRLSEDAARRAKNKEELQSKAREEEKQKAVPVVIKGKAAPAAKK